MKHSHSSNHLNSHSKAQMIQYRSITNIKGKDDDHNGNPFMSTYSMNFANPKDKKGNPIHHSAS